ncbi:MAG: DUF5602 domain-containing protein [Segetibacter sp.]
MLLLQPYFSLVKKLGFGRNFCWFRCHYSTRKGKSWVKLDANGTPIQLGLSIDDAAMNSLPGDGEESEVILPLSTAAKTATPFDHIEVDWNPRGHEPAGVYDKPHLIFIFTWFQRLK